MKEQEAFKKIEVTTEAFQMDAAEVEQWPAERAMATTKVTHAGIVSTEHGLALKSTKIGKSSIATSATVEDWRIDGATPGPMSI